MATLTARFPIVPLPWTLRNKAVEYELVLDYDAAELYITKPDSSGAVGDNRFISIADAITQMLIDKGTFTADTLTVIIDGEEYTLKNILTQLYNVTEGIPDFQLNTDNDEGKMLIIDKDSSGELFIKSMSTTELSDLLNLDNKADKSYVDNAMSNIDMSTKADKKKPAAANNIAVLDTNGNLADGGKTISSIDSSISSLNSTVSTKADKSYVDTSISNLNISTKADKIVPAATNNIAILDANGNLADGGKTISSIDSSISSLNSTVSTKLPKSGGTMTGKLTLSGAPTDNLHAATKSYVDTSISNLSISTKADKKVPAATNNIAVLNANGNLADGGKTISSINSSISSKADKSYVDSSYTIAGKKSGTTLGNHSTTEGYINTASGECSHAEGRDTIASGDYSHSEGKSTKASGNYSHVEGFFSEATASYAHAQGYYADANGTASLAQGAYVIANGASSYAGGFNTVSNDHASFVIGVHNVVSSGDSEWPQTTNSAFIIGNGTSSSKKANAFRVVFDSNVYGGTYHNSGADYAEYFEWSDKNINNEDRIGYFVTFDHDNMIKKAGINDDIFGIVSGSAGVIGDCYEDNWQGMYIKDSFGRLIYEDTEVERVNENGETESALKTCIKYNPNYDSSVTYIPRSKRKEWDAIGLLGKIYVRDDGTCIINEKCVCNANGIATKSENNEGYRVIERITDNIIRIFFK